MRSQKNKAPYWRQMSPEGYLINLTDGSTEWYHLTSRTNCTFEPGRLTYLCADKQYLLGELDAILNDEQRESGRARICKVRVRGLNWSDVFDIADYLEPGGGEDSDVNARGKALEEKYSCDIPTTYHYDSFEAMYICDPLKMGFKAWLEDEGNYWPENPSGYWPETLVVATGDGVEIEVVGEDLLERAEDSWRWRLVERENPDRTWFDTQTLQNDADGYLINPDTGSIYWYHGSKHGTLAYGGDVIYLTSNIDTAYEFACIDPPIFDDGSWEASVYEIKIKIPARNIFDVRQSTKDPRVERLCETLGLYAGGVGDLHYENFDVGLGYSGGRHRAEAIDLGFGGWLETETPYLHYGETTPCSIGLFTDLERSAYEIVHEWRIGTDECVRVELSAES